MTGCARCSCTIPSRSSACSTRLLRTTMHSRARTDTRCAALPAALITTTSRTRFAAFRLSASTPWPEPPERRGRGRQRRSSSAARLGMPTSKWKRSGCALRIVCAAAVPGCVLHQDSFVRLLPAYPVSRPAAVFASPGLSGCPPSGWAARGASRAPLGRLRRCAAASRSLSSAIPPYLPDLHATRAAHARNVAILTPRKLGMTETAVLWSKRGFAFVRCE